MTHMDLGMAGLDTDDDSAVLLLTHHHHVAGEEVDLSDELGDEAGVRLAIHLGRRTDLLDAPAVHQHDAITHRERFFLIVRHVDERRAHGGLDPAQLEVHRLTQLQVEGRERFVEEQHLWMVGQRPGEGDALRLSAGELARRPILESLQPDQAEQLGDPFGNLRLVRRAIRRAKPTFSPTVLWGKRA